MDEPAYIFEILGAVYELLVVFLFGTFGNLLTILILVKSRKYCQSTNIFVFNLALSDVLVCFLNILNWIANFLPSKSDEICKYYMPIYLIPLLTSQFNLALIAINRYLFIFKNKELYNKLFSDENSIIFCVCLWMFSGILASWPLIFTRYIFRKLYLTCEMESNQSGKPYSLVVGLICLIINVFIIGIFYILIFRGIRKSRRRVTQVNIVTQTATSNFSSTFFLYTLYKFLMYCIFKFIYLFSISIFEDDEPTVRKQSQLRSRTEKTEFKTAKQFFIIWCFYVTLVSPVVIEFLVKTQSGKMPVIYDR